MPTFPLVFHLNPLTNPWVEKLTQTHTLIEQKPTGFRVPIAISNWTWRFSFQRQTWAFLSNEGETRKGWPEIPGPTYRRPITGIGQCTSWNRTVEPSARGAVRGVACMQLRPRAAPSPWRVLWLSVCCWVVLWWRVAWPLGGQRGVRRCMHALALLDKSQRISCCYSMHRRAADDEGVSAQPAGRRHRTRTVPDKAISPAPVRCQSSRS
jgi:hypothetical protein